jgi:hypothetical protein
VLREEGAQRGGADEGLGEGSDREPSDSQALVWQGTFPQCSPRYHTVRDQVLSKATHELSY